MVLLVVAALMGASSAQGDWPPSDMRLWLRTLGLGRYAARCEREGIDGELLHEACRSGEMLQSMLDEVRRYVPGCRIKNGPVFDGNRVSIFLEIEGLGDYLPKYAGNLDIMTAAALRTDTRRLNPLAPEDATLPRSSHAEAGLLEPLLIIQFPRRLLRSLRRRRL